jgi:integration host factor subunit alpha
MTMSRTITRADLSEAVYKKVGITRGESAELVDQILNEISDAFVRGEEVKLSSFATFSVRAKNERVGRNPKTGEEKVIARRTVLTFKASHVLKAKVLNGNQKVKGLQRNKV